MKRVAGLPCSQPGRRGLSGPGRGQLRTSRLSPTRTSLLLPSTTSPRAAPHNQSLSTWSGGGGAGTRETTALSTEAALATAMS